VRKGAPRPDISTPEAFKRTLLSAKSVAYSGDGSSGRYFLDLLEHLGIAEDMKAKLKPQPTGNSPAQAVATGQAEMAVTGIAIILAVPGAELVGSLPSELQSYVLFTGGVGVAAKEAEAGRALLNFLTTPEAAAAFKARGVEPVVP
jgi:molybdate transport system substrate-binding protein